MEGIRVREYKKLSTIEKSINNNGPDVRYIENTSRSSLLTGICILTEEERKQREEFIAFLQS